MCSQLFNSKPVSKVSSNVFVENVNGVLYATKNGIKSIIPIAAAKNIKFDFDDLLLGTPDSVSIANNKISVKQTNNIVSNGFFKNIEAPNIILILSANKRFCILPGGNVNISSKLEVDKSIALVQHNNLWNVLSCTKEIRKEVIVPVEKIVERIVDIPVEREVIVEKIVRKEVIVEREVLVERAFNPNANINSITYVITPALDSNPSLYNRELKTIEHLSEFKGVHIKILIQQMPTAKIKKKLKAIGVEIVIIEKTNSRGLVQLSDIIKHGLNDSDAMIYTNSDCILDPKYINKALKIKDIDFLMRNNDGKNLYKIGLDGFYLTKEYYSTLKQCFNFYVGEPFWDVSFYNLVKKINSNASVDTFHLTHKSHTQNWDISNLSAMGKFNEALHSHNMKRFEDKKL